MCEHLYVSHSKIYTARGGSFRWEKLLKHTSLIRRTLYNAKMAFAFGHLSEDKIKKGDDKTQAPDILNIMGEISSSGLLRLDASRKVNVKNKELGIYKHIDIPKPKAYLLGKGNDPEVDGSDRTFFFLGSEEGYG